MLIDIYLEGLFYIYAIGIWALMKTKEDIYMNEVRCIEVPKNVGYVKLGFVVNQKELVYYAVSIVKNPILWRVFVTDPNGVITVKNGRPEDYMIGDIEFIVSNERVIMSVMETSETYILIWGN